MTVLASVDQPPHQEGVLFYDEDSHTLTLFNDESDISLQIGQEQYIRVRNNTSATITDGAAVRITGAHGNVAPEISLASADTNDKSLAVGLATHPIESNSFGYVTVQGTVHSLNTTGFNEGQELYLSTTSGGLTGVSPILPNYSNSLGICIRSHATEGSILVNLGKSKLGGGDVKSTAVVNVSGIPFYTQAADGYAGGVQTDTSLAYDSGNTRIELGAGGIKFNDGTTQTTAPVAGSTYSYWTATDGVSSTNILDTNTVKLTGIGNTTVTLDGGTYTINGTGGGGGDTDTVYAWSLCGADVPSGANVTIAGGTGVQVSCGLTTTISTTGMMSSGSFAEQQYTHWVLQGAGNDLSTPPGDCSNNSTIAVQKEDVVSFKGSGSVAVCMDTTDTNNTIVTISGEPKYLGWDAKGFRTGDGVEQRVESTDDVMFTGVGSVDVIMHTGVGNVKYIISGIEGEAYSKWRATDGVTINNVIDNELVTWTGVGLASVSMDDTVFSISGADTIYLGGSGIEISGTESPYTINGERATARAYSVDEGDFTGTFGMTYLDHDISGASATTAATPSGVRDYVQSYLSTSGFDYWTVSDGSISSNIDKNDTITFTQGGTVTTTLTSGDSSNTLNVSGTPYTAGHGLTLAGYQFNARDATTSVTGIVRLQDSAEDGVVDKAITPNAVYDISGVLAADIAATGAANAADIAATGATNAAAISGKDNYRYWNISDGFTSENISGTNQVTFQGGGDTTTSYNTGTNTLTITSTDNNTLYYAGTGLNLDPSTTFNVSGSTVDNSGIVQLQDSATNGTVDRAITPNAVYDISGVLAADISTNATNIATNVTNLVATGAKIDTLSGVLIAPQYITLATSPDLTNERSLAAGDGLAGTDGGANAAYTLSVNVDDSSIETNADTLRVKADGITAAMLNTDVTLDEITDHGATTTNNITVGMTTTSGVLTPLVSGSGAASVTFDLSTASTFTYSIDETTTLALSNVTAGQKFMVRLKQDTTGSRGVNWFSTVYWAEGGTAPTLTALPLHSDVFGFLCTTSGYYDGFVIGQNISGV